MGTEERRERERSARYETIVASARELFFAKGFTTTTMDEIAQQAELSKGSLYLHFPSKEALYATVMNEGLAILFDRLEAAFQLELPPDRMLRRFGEVHYRYYIDYREYSRIFFFREHRDVTKLLPRELIQDNLEKARRCLQRIIEVIQQGVDKDIFAAVDSRQAAIAFWGATNGILFLFEDELNKELFGLNVEPLFFYTIDLFIGALKKR